MAEGTEVASRALPRYLHGAVVAAITGNLGVLALQADRMEKIRIQAQGGPGLTVAG